MKKINSLNGIKIKNQKFGFTQFIECNHKVICNYLTFGLISLLISCNGSRTEEVSVEEAVEFTRVEYKNTELQTDLGVGLWAWPLPIDYDNDGDFDLVVSCPDVPFKGLYFFENKTRSNAANTVFEKPVRLENGKKNLQVSHIDGKSYVLGRGVEYQDFKSNTFSNANELFKSDSIESGHTKIRFSQWKYVDYENDGDLDLIVGIDDWGDYGWDNAFNEKGEWVNGPLHGYVYLLENDNGHYIEKGKIQAGGEPIDLYGAPSPNMYDFDGDGDLDLICGEFLDRFTWFENIGTREKPVYSEGRFLSNEDGIIKMELEMIIPSAIDWDKDGDVDLVVGDEDGRVALIENTGDIKNKMPVFKSPVYFKQRAGNVKFGALVTPYSVDWDDDGDEDLICGNSAGYIGFIENLDGGSSPNWAAPKRLLADGKEIRYLAGDSGSIQGPAEKKWGYTTLSVNDWDGDGLKDIIVNSIWGRIEWHKNVGVKGNPKLLSAHPVVVDWGNGEIPKPKWNWWNPKATELSTQWRTTPVTIDWNKDGMMDLVMLDHEGYLVWFERFKAEGNELRLKPGQKIFHELKESFGKDSVVMQTKVPLRLTERENGGSGRRKWTFADWDQDGDLDIIVNTRPNAALYENMNSSAEGVDFKYKGDFTELKLAGHTTSPTMVDWDKNGIPDLLLGAEDGHLYYLKNKN